MRSWYDLLQVRPDADPEVIAAAYRALSKRYHPDVNKAADSTSVMKEINYAYEILSNPVERAKYDRNFSAKQDTRPSAQPAPAQKNERQTDAPPDKERAQKKTNSQEVRILGKDGRFIAYSDGTVLDTKTNLMWAARDNGAAINWGYAKLYCENYRGGSYTDWRMPTQDELAGLYDRGKTQPGNDFGWDIHMVTELIHITGDGCWALETRKTWLGSKAAYFTFDTGRRLWYTQSSNAALRALPVRSGK